jgi:hypothetical protein
VASAAGNGFQTDVVDEEIELLRYCGDWADGVVVFGGRCLCPFSLLCLILALVRYGVVCVI